MNGQFWHVNTPHKLSCFIDEAKRTFKENGFFQTKFQTEVKRREIQNRLAFHWYRELEGQGDMTALEYRAKCKLHFACPILREQSESFNAQFASVIEPLTYEQRIACMSEPFDLPVTRLLTVKNMARYLNEVLMFSSERGYKLTTSDDLYRQAMGIKQ